MCRELRSGRGDKRCKKHVWPGPPHTSRTDQSARCHEKLPLPSREDLGRNWELSFWAGSWRMRRQRWGKGKGWLKRKIASWANVWFAWAEDRTHSMCDGGRRGNSLGVGSCIHPAFSLSSAAGLGEMETARKPGSRPAALSPSPSHLPLWDGEKLRRMNGGRSRQKALHFSTGDLCYVFLLFSFVSILSFSKAWQSPLQERKREKVGRRVSVAEHSYLFCL